MVGEGRHETVAVDYSEYIRQPFLILVLYCVENHSVCQLRQGEMCYVWGQDQQHFYVYAICTLILLALARAFTYVYMHRSS